MQSNISCHKVLASPPRPSPVRNAPPPDTKPFNVASYALLTLMIGQVSGSKPDDFVWSGGGRHLNSNHLEQARTQLARTPRTLPKMTLNPAVRDLPACQPGDFTLSHDEPHPHIKAPVAV